jgi:hypothetical protein
MDARWDIEDSKTLASFLDSEYRQFKKFGGPLCTMLEWLELNDFLAFLDDRSG